VRLRATTGVRLEGALAHGGGSWTGGEVLRRTCPRYGRAPPGSNEPPPTRPFGPCQALVPRHADRRARNLWTTRAGPLRRLLASAGPVLPDQPRNHPRGRPHRCRRPVPGHFSTGSSTSCEKARERRHISAWFFSTACGQLCGRTILHQSTPRVPRRAHARRTGMTRRHA
jgi:hypothetical protein